MNVGRGQNWVSSPPRRVWMGSLDAKRSCQRLLEAEGIAGGPHPPGCYNPSYRVRGKGPLTMVSSIGRSGSVLIGTDLVSGGGSELSVNFF